MESKDFQCSQLDGSWYNNMPPPQQFNVGQSSNNAEWSFEENEVFENALAQQLEVVGSPAFFQNLATMIPFKSMQDIKIHFEALVKDIEMIESDLFPIPEYKTQEDTRPHNTDLVEETTDKNENRSPSYETKKTSTVQRRRGVPWTEEEHQLFLMGLNKYGKGDWRSISRYYVNSKTPTQIASHAQKFFRRQISTTPMERRRPSIHDIQTVTYHMPSIHDIQPEMHPTTYTPSIHDIQLETYPTTHTPSIHNIQPETYPTTHTPSIHNIQPETHPTTYIPSIHDIQTEMYPTTTYTPQPILNTNSSSAQMPFQWTTALMNNSISGVSTNLEQNPVMFVPESHFNSISYMPSSSMNNHQFG